MKEYGGACTREQKPHDQDPEAQLAYPHPPAPPRRYDHMSRISLPRHAIQGYRPVSNQLDIVLPLPILLVMPGSDKRRLASEKLLARVWTEVQRTEAKARQRRDAALRRAHRDGLTIRQIAEITGLSHGRVGQIVSKK
jgi:hypothetical protein